MSIHDIMKARASMVKSVRNLPHKYSEMYSSVLFAYLYDTLQEIKNRKNLDTTEEIDPEKYEEIVKRVERFVDDSDPGQKAFSRFARIATLYLVFIEKKPIHPPGMIFPGELKIIEEKGGFYCPVRDKQSEVDIALCEFCICKDLSELETQ
ncbi:DUF2115 domain-containing protein [Methanolobus sp. ZRKC3]|uniref:DUF2115 domain-containing protein n=1 Tax=Methanolobus sp. ZRKC3 TaxID=3125786 RepID=UPI0032554586